MKKTRLFAGVMAGALLAATLAGCNSAPSSASTPGSAAASGSSAGVVEVTIPSYKTGENVGAVFFGYFYGIFPHIIIFRINFSFTVRDWIRHNTQSSQHITYFKD